VDTGTVLVSIAQIALGGGLVQIAVRAGGAFSRRVSKSGQRQTNVTTDSTSVETADAVLVMVRGELQRLREQQAAEKKEWDTERATTTESLENAAREVQRAHAELARAKSDLSVAQAQISQRDGPGPGRHANTTSPSDDWRRGP
jgi:hypothetical protein